MFYRGVIILHVWAQGVVWQPGQWYRTEIVTGKIFSDNGVCVRYQSLLIHQLLMSYNISIKSGTNICFAVEEVKRLRGNPCYIYTRKESNMIQHGEGEEKISDGREVQREVSHNSATKYFGILIFSIQNTHYKCVWKYLRGSAHQHRLFCIIDHLLRLSLGLKITVTKAHVLMRMMKGGSHRILFSKFQTNFKHFSVFCTPP